jgi:hypothetical protein
MKTLFTLLIFCVVLFIYIHINFHLKVSNDLEVYEIDQPSKDKLEEICDLRQPVIFDYNVDGLINDCNLDTISNNFGAFDIKVRNVKEYDDVSELYLPLTLNTAMEIFRKDKNERFVSENNGDFLEETSIIKSFRYNDNFLRPYSVSNCTYDLMFSSKNTRTPLKYELNYRNFFLVTQGSVRLKLIPPKSSKYLYTINDYDNFEFLSPVNPWNVQSQFKPDFDKLKTLEVSLKVGQIIYIPAYWWYSFEFAESTSICVFKYRTYMNNIAISNHLLVNLLQTQNVKRETVKKIDTDNAGKKISNDTSHIDTSPIDTSPIDTSPIDTLSIDTLSIDRPIVNNKK